MARNKFQTLTEQMFYILLALQSPCCGVDCMERVRQMTQGRTTLGPGTLYTLLASFEEAGLIAQTALEGRRRIYAMTPAGRDMLQGEYARLKAMTADYAAYYREEEKQ